jgi:hypothetical protein
VSEQEPVTVKAWLEGDIHDLQALERLLDDGDPRVVRDPDREAYYLTAPEIDNPPSGRAFYETAKELIARINGFGRVADPGFRPVRLSGAFSEGDSQHQVIFAEAALELRVSMQASATVRHEDGTVVPPAPSPWPGRLALAAKHPDVAEAFEIMSQFEPLGWSELFKVHEKIQDSIGGSIPKMGWASNADDDAFGASANRYDVSGRDARHARREKRLPPKRTMTIQQARHYISGIVIKWLEWLRNQP